jgi:2-polyprenyl-3-methyl-5-hydroxy-6-metoxy-1,4-benzoquinol methylase
MAEEIANRCLFCGGDELRLAFAGGYHKRKKDHGPFDLYQCRECGSAVTYPLPSPAVLASYYTAVTTQGLSHAARDVFAADPEAGWHDACARRLITLAAEKGTESLTWVDVGAGGGEVASRLAAHFPASRGIAVDIHDRPASLHSSVEWRRIDIGDENWADHMGKADLVFAVGVWEHVRRPDLFARAMISLLSAGGALYMMTPNFGSIARRLLGARWPYYAPGEHVCMPTPKGARVCLAREFARVHAAVGAPRISARPITLPYSPQLLAVRFGVPQLGRALPQRPRIRLPPGAMECVLKWPEAKRRGLGVASS